MVPKLVGNSCSLPTRIPPPPKDRFLLLARYTLLTLRRGVYEINVSKYILTTDRRPTTDLSFGKFRMTIYPQWVIRSTSCLVLWYRVFRVGRLNGATCISGSVKSKMVAMRLISEGRVAYLRYEETGNKRAPFNYCSWRIL